MLPPVNFMAFHSAVYSYGVVRFGAVLLHRTAPYDFAFNKTAPHRTVRFQTSKFAKGRIKRGDFVPNIAPKCSEPRGGPYLTAWHENSKKEHTLLGCALHHPSLREVEGLRGPASFTTVVIVTRTIGDAGVTG